VPLGLEHFNFTGSFKSRAFPGALYAKLVTAHFVQIVVRSRC
jgi:hypothetical protein